MSQAKFRILKVTILLSLVVCFSTFPPVVSAMAGEPWTQCVKKSSSGIRVLFVGHSKFYWHDMPKMLAGMARRQPVTISYVFGDAYSLEDHWRKGVARKVILSQRPNWDYVVFIEKTNRPKNRPELFEKYVKLFDKTVKSVGAKTILVESYTDEVSRYQARHETMKNWHKKLGLPVVPVATAWNEVRTKYPRIQLYAPDGHHPNVAGTYLMSCMFYSYLLRQSPYNLSSRLSYTDKKTGSTIVFKSQTDCRNVQNAVSQALKGMN